MEKGAKTVPLRRLKKAALFGRRIARLAFLKKSDEHLQFLRQALRGERDASAALGYSAPKAVGRLLR